MMSGQRQKRKKEYIPGGKNKRMKSSYRFLEEIFIDLKFGREFFFTSISFRAIKSNLDEVLTRRLLLKLYFQILIEIKFRLYKLCYLFRLDL